jgi:lipase chaperone LimK
MIELSLSKYDIKGEGKMRVYEPDRDRSTFQAILKELYVLRQAIDHQALSVDERVKMIDKIRHEIQQVAQA